jgi:hypothetical protein
MGDATWWIDVMLLCVIAGIVRKVIVLARENGKLRDIIRHLEGVGNSKRKEEESEELGCGDAEGQS